jgi:histidine triad (HIT) family protein
VTEPSGRRTDRVQGAGPGHCLFCRIARGETPAHVAYSDDLFVGFLDHRPLFPGHVLLVPREHVDTLLDAPPELLAPLAHATQRVSVAVRDAMEADGVFNAVNNVVSQSVPHLHVHVVPRRRKDGLRGFFWPRTKYASDEEAQAVATRIRARISANGGL